MRGKLMKTGIRKIITFNIIMCLILLTFFVTVNMPYGAVPTPEVEPNDTFAEASNNKVSNGTYNGSVDQNDKRDYFEVDLDAGQTLSLVYKTDPGGNDTALVLYNGDKQEIWNTSWVAFGGIISSSYTINQTVIGPYYLVVMAKDNGNEYNLTIEIKSQNDAGQNKDAGDTLTSALEIFGGTNSGYLANEDVDDYYKFTVPASGIFKLNLSVSGKYSNPITFDVFNDTMQMIRRIPDLAPGATQFYTYTLNNTANRVFYTRAKIVSGKNEYNITLTFNVQDDAVTLGDASDNLSNAVSIATQNVEYIGWLGGGNKGDDDVDVYTIPILITEEKMKVNISITTNSSLDIIVYIYNDSFGLIETKDIGAGAQLVHEFKILTLPVFYVKLSVDPGKSSDGDYSIKYTAVGVSPSEVDEDGDNLPDEWEISNNLNASDASGINGSKGDPDNDGLKNLGEYNIDADPNDPDSDADGMKDGWEVDNTLDPVADDSSQDPDEDGYTNLQEYQNQTDPNDILSRPLAGFKHLTAEAVKRVYNDAKTDVRYWRGTYNNVTDEQTIAEGKIGDYPDYDLVSLTSIRDNNNLVVKLKVKGSIHDSGYVEATRSNGDEGLEGTFYWVAFVDKSYSEPVMDDTTGLIFVNPWSEDNLFQLVYVNNTSIGTPGTKYQKVDNGQSIEWRVPLSDISSLPADFEMYGSVMRLLITSAGSIDTFETHFDSLGAGSIPIGDSDISYKKEKLGEVDGHKVKVVIVMDDPSGVIIIEKANKPSGKIPDDTGDLGIYVNIELHGNVVAKEIFLSIEYNESIIPEGFSEKDIKIMYYNASIKGWVKVPNSGVWRNNNTAWARPKHLTIFGPMARSDEEEPGVENFWLILASLIIIIVVVIVIVVAVAVIQKRKKSRFRPAPGPSRAQRSLTPEFFPCPRCGEELEIPYAETQEVGLECQKCGARGKIDNPYLHEGGRPEEGHARDRDDRGYDPEYDRDHERDSERDYDQDYDRDGERDYDRDRGGGYEHKPERRGGGRESEGETERDRDIDIDYHRPRPRRDREARGHEREREYEPEPKPAELEEEMDYEFKACPKCKKDIPIPYEEDEKIILKCPYCGAAGKVKNPYI